MLRRLQKPFEIVAAICHGRGLGKDGKIPWSCPQDMDYFKQLTLDSKPSTRNAVVMGRRTWESLRGPLKGRLNVVITRDYRASEYQIPNVAAFPSLLHAHIWLDEQCDVDRKFVIGGQELYQEALQANWSKRLYLTLIPEHFDCDVHFPQVPNYYRLAETLTLPTYIGSDVKVEIYDNRYGRHYEEQYLQQMNYLLHHGQHIVGRNGLVHTDFQWSFTVDLADGLPLFSTRKAFWKGIAKELLFFIHGDTNSKHLEADGIRIWQGNTTKEFLRSRNLDYDEGDMGPMYGWVWRHYGARYHGAYYDYTGQGYDQLRDVLDKLLHDPWNRRILMTAYEPTKVQESVLAPCHSIVNHFYVREGRDPGQVYLDMYTYQRSADMYLGVYFNIPSDAVLQTILAKAVGMIPGKLYIQFGNCHVYDEHCAALEEQLQRTPADVLPTLHIRSEPPVCSSTDQALKWIESLQYSDLVVNDYQPQGHIAAPMIA